MPVINDPLDSPRSPHWHYRGKTREELMYQLQWVTDEVINLRKNAWSEEDKERVDKLLEMIEYLLSLLASLGGDEHFRGAWSTDEVYNKFDLVYHLGCKWMCLLDNTTEEPTWYADTWLYMSGDNRFKIDIDSSAGTSFRGSDIDTTFTVTLWFGSFNVTEKFGNQNGRKVVWSRDTGNATKDKAWSPTYVGSNGMKLRIRLYDVGLDFRERGYTSFTITLGIPTSSGYDQVTRTINIK